VGTFRNVVVSNIVAKNCSAVGCAIAGLPGHRIENVTLSNINLGFDGGGTKEDAVREIPEKPAGYPESTMFGTLSAYGFFCRHVTGLTLHNVRLNTTEPDARHALVFDDVEASAIDALWAPFAPDAAPLLSVVNSRDVAIRNCHPPVGTDVFLKLEGEGTRGITVYNNNFANIESICSRGQDVADSALVQWSNYGLSRP
jgi:hypothetical protein